jgi:thiol-disulfide isomerase/thioredoxin
MLSRTAGWVVALSVIIFIAGCGEKPAPGQAELEKFVGRGVAAVTVQDLAGKDHTLGELGGGRPLVVNVWATWCAPCLEELPGLDALAARGEWKVVAIATDRDSVAVKAFLARHPLPHLVVTWDSLGMATGDGLGARGLPASYVLDGAGTVWLVASGARAWDNPAMAAKIKRALR